VTAQERRVLDMIEAYVEQTRGVHPTIREIAEQLGLRSTGSVHKIISQLRSDGFLKPVRRIELSQNTCPKCGKRQEAA
jgi:SOS-response transcriptional repressor LexA